MSRERHGLALRDARVALWNQQPVSEIRRDGKSQSGPTNLERGHRTNTVERSRGSSGPPHQKGEGQDLLQLWTVGTPEETVSAPWLCDRTEGERPVRADCIAEVGQSKGTGVWLSPRSRPRFQATKSSDLLEDKMGWWAPWEGPRRRFGACAEQRTDNGWLAPREGQRGDVLWEC